MSVKPKAAAPATKASRRQTRRAARLRRLRQKRDPIDPMAYSGNLARGIVLVPLLIYIGHSWTSYRTRQQGAAAQSALLDQLDSAGYVVLKAHNRFSGVVPAALDAHLEALWAADEGDDGGGSVPSDASQLLGAASGATRRLSNLIAKDDANRTLAALASDPIVLQMCGRVVGGLERLKLSSLTARSAPGRIAPGRRHGAAAPRAALRAESDAVADAGGSWLCTALWMVTNYTLHSGVSASRLPLLHISYANPSHSLTRSP